MFGSKISTDKYYKNENFTFVFALASMHCIAVIVLWIYICMYVNIYMFSAMEWSFVTTDFK